MKDIVDYIEILHSLDIYIPTRTIYIGTETVDNEENEEGIDALVAAKAIKNLHILNNLSTDPITIILNSIGGDEQHGMAIYDAIKDSKSPTIIKVYGQADSSASVILQAGKKRLMSEHSRMTLHYGQIEFRGESETAMSWAKEEHRSRDLTVELFYGILKKKDLNITRKAVHKMLVSDTILTAQQALKLGLIDEIIK